MSDKKEVVYTSKAPAAAGPYSQGVCFGDFLFVSGMIPINPETGELLKGNFPAEAKQVMENIKAVVEAGGTGMENVLMATVALKDIADAAVFNEIYAGYFAVNPPARQTFAVSELPKGASVEVSVICSRGL